MDNIGIILLVAIIILIIYITHNCQQKSKFNVPNPISGPTTLSGATSVINTMQSQLADIYYSIDDMQQYVSLDSNNNITIMDGSNNVYNMGNLNGPTIQSPYNSSFIFGCKIKTTAITPNSNIP